MTDPTPTASEPKGRSRKRFIIIGAAAGVVIALADRPADEVGCKQQRHRLDLGTEHLGAAVSAQVRALKDACTAALLARNHRELTRMLTMAAACLLLCKRLQERTRKYAPH